MLVSCFAIILLAFPSLASAAPRPVIVDSDLGSSADDNFALALALASKHLDVVLVVVTSGDTLSSARVAARRARPDPREPSGGPASRPISNVRADVDFPHPIAWRQREKI